MKGFRSQIKKGRQAFYQAAVQARQMGNFASNPVAFSWRLARQWGTNWLNAPDEPETTPSPLSDGSENESAIENGRGTVAVASPSTEPVLGDNVIALENGQYVMTTENLAAVEGQEIYGGYGTTSEGDRDLYPVAIEKMARDRFEKPDRVFSKFSASNSLRESEYRLALKFRIVLPKAFVELSDDAQSVYLVYDLNNTQIDPQKMTTLSRVLRPFTPVEIDSILKDIWQSLDYLHNRLRYGEDLPVAHGNLSLDTLLFSEDEKVYLWQLGLWHKNAISPHYTTDLESSKISVDANKKRLAQPNEKKRDIVTVGKAISKLLSPRYATSDTALQDYLADVAEGRFESARAAQKYLIELDIPTRKFWEVEPQAISPVESVELEKTPRKEGLKKIRSIFYILLPIVLFGSWGWWLTRKLATANVTLLEEAVYHDFSQGCFDGEGDIDRCQMAKAIDRASQQDLIPSDFTIYYTSIWKYFLESSSFNIELRKRQGNGNKIEWNWRLTDFNRFNELSLGESLLITHDRAEIFNQRNMALSIIAYDGLVALVSPKLAEVLNGKISREQLQEIYRGTLQEWDKIEGVENFNKEIVLLRPRNAEFVKLFQGLLFGELANTVVENSRAVDNILEEVAKANDAAIAFAPLSFVMGQCSVYPLAIVGENGTVQAFVDTYGKPITPQTDLCDDKGGYTANFDKLVREGAYPLSYRVVVAYRETGNETPPLFVEVMTTDEGQSLLRALGLVPCRIPGEEFCQFPEQS